jgi:hypothetical protein
MSSQAALIVDRRPIVTLDEASHVYTHRDGGFQPPSVTHILGSVPPWLHQFDHADPADVAYKGALGRQAHKATHYSDEGTLDPTSVDLAVRPYLGAWQRFVGEKRFVVRQMETAVFHPAHGYAGTLDRLGDADTERGRGLVLADIKTGDGTMAGPQTAAYLEAWRAMILSGYVGHPRDAAEPCERWTVQLHPTGRYTLTPHRSRRDWQVFLAALTLWSYRHDHSLSRT